jgi:hypothetical protein
MAYVPVKRKPRPHPTYDFPNGFSGGMNISVSPDQISPNQSPSMQDCNYDDGGIPTKRYGFSRVNALSWGTPIRGTHEFYQIGQSDPIFLIAQGGKLWSYNELTDTRTDLCTGTVLSFADAPVSFFVQGDKCFFLTGNEFLYYDGTNPVATVQSISYIPTTVMGRAPSGTGGKPNEKFNHLTNKWKESFSGDNTSTTYQLTKQADVTLSTDPLTAWVDGVQKSETTDFTVDRTAWTVTFAVAPSQGTDNVVIQAEATNLMDPTLITKCTMAIEFAGKTDSHVLVSGNPEHPNTVYYNAVYDCTYWPEDDDFNVGGDSRDISGWGRMNEYLVTYKEPGDEYGQYYSQINIDSTTGAVSYETYGLNDEFGCIAPKTVHPAQGGLLALSDKGVVWTWPSLVKGQANCKMVSRNVNGRNGIGKGILDNTQTDLKNAHAEVYLNKYLLHVADTVWVLDLDYSDLANNVFCWYPYKGLYSNAGLFFNRSQRLYMADNANGLVYSERNDDELLKWVDDGQLIDAWWSSPLMFLGGRDWIKKFERINLTFKPTHGTEHILSLISDLGVEDIPLRQEAGRFDFRFFNFLFFNLGVSNFTYPSTQSEKIGYKGEYFQFKIRNNSYNRGLTMLAANITFSLRKKVK